MSTFSKRYSLPNEPNKSIYLTWETGFKNVKVYFDGRLITTIARPTELKSGFYFEDSVLGNIKIKFSSSRPIVLNVSIEGTSYYPENSKNDREGFAGLVTLFWIIFGLGTLGTVFAYSQLISIIDSSFLIAAIIIDVLMLAAYAVAAIFLNKRQGWAYFLGVTVFLHSTIVYLYINVASYFGLTVGPIVVLIIRVAFLIYMFTFLKNALIAMRAPSAELADDLLDN
jgi:hypothetical protein